MTRILVLGGTGYIGGHIALAALRRGWKVRGLRRRPGATGHIDQADVTWFDGDLDRPETLAPAFDGVEIVFHAAAYVPQNSRNVPSHIAHGVGQIRNVVEAARRAGVERLVFTSTLTTIGHPREDERRLADERDHYVPGSLARSAYYECKYAMESEVLRAVAHGLPALVVNPTAVIGPGDIHPSLGGALLWVARGWLLAWLPVQLNVVDVRDVAQAQVTAAEVGRVGERYILGGYNLSMQDLMVRATSIAGVGSPRFEIPLGLVDAMVGLGRFIPPLDQFGNHLRAVRYWQGYNCGKAHQELKMIPRSLEETLSDAIDWYRANGYLG